MKCIDYMLIEIDSILETNQISISQTLLIESASISDTFQQPFEL